MNEYSDYILELYRNPIKKKRLQNSTHTTAYTNTSCGDMVTIDLLVNNDTIIDIGWDGSGCAISQAGMSILADQLLGKKYTDLHTIDANNILQEIGFSLSPKRTKCALIGLEALRKLK